jgi:hypothetical protein
MNDQAINDAYQMFSQGGYNGSIDNFKQLIASNPNALNDSYEIFKSGGYSDDIDSFKTLMGVSNSFSNPFIKKKSPGGVSISADGSSESQEPESFMSMMRDISTKQIAEDKEKAKQLQATGFRKEMKDAEAIELSGKEQPLSKIYDEYDDFFKTKNQQATGVEAFIKSQSRPKGGNDYNENVSFDPGLGIAVNDTRYRVKDGFWERLVQGDSKYEKITNASSISALNKRYDRDLSTDVAPIEVKPSVIDPFIIVNSDFLSKTEEDAQTALENKFGGMGFEFEQTGFGTDYIKVTPKNGAAAMTFSFDEKSSDEAIRLQSFLRNNASFEKESLADNIASLMINMEDEGSADYLKYFKELTYLQKKEEIARREKKAAGFKYSEASGIWKLLGSEEDDKKVDIKAEKEFEKLYNSEEYKLFNSEKSKFEQQQEDRYSLLLDDYEIKQRNGDYEGARKAKLAIESGFSRDVIGDNVTNLSNSQYDLMSAKNNLVAKETKLREQASKGLITQEQFDIGAEAILVESKKLAISAESVNSNQKKMNALAGMYMLEKAKYGNFGSNLWNGFVIGTNEVGNLLTSPSMDPKKGLGEVEKGRTSRIITPQQQKYYDDKGYNEEEVKNILYNKAELSAIKANKKAVIESIGFDLTTEESKSQLGFVKNALVGVAASLPSMALRLVPGAGQALAFAGMANMSYNAIEEEMLSDPDFETTTKGERALVAVPYAAVMGYLENLGISKMTKGQSALLGKYILGNMAKALPKKMGREVVENIVNKEVKSLVGKGVLKVVAGGLAEGETGAMQTLFADIGMKKAYNSIRAAYTGEDLTELTGGEAFGTPQSFSEGALAVGEGALAEAIGGFAMSTVMVGAQGLATGKISLYNKDDLKFFEDFSSDEQFKKIIVTDLKTKMLEGTMTKSEAQAALNNIDLVAGVFNSIDENIPEAAKIEAFNLINEKRRLEKEVEGKDPALSKKSNDRIAEINTRLEELPSLVQEDNLITRASDIEYALGRGRGKSKTVRIDGKRVSREEAETELQTIITKIEENAIQKQTASEVLVQPTTTIGEEVVQGEPQTELEVITKEGEAQEQRFKDKEYLTAEETLNFSINNAKENIENRILRFQKSEDPSSEDWIKSEKEELNQLNENPLAYFEAKLQQEITHKTPIPERIGYFEMIINEFKAVENAQAAPTQELAPVTQELVLEEVTPQAENLTLRESLLLEAEKAKGKKGKAPRAARVRKAPVVTAPALEVEAAPIVVEPTQEAVVAPVVEAPVVTAPVTEAKEGAPTKFYWDKIKEYTSEVIRSMRQLQFSKLNPLLELKKPSSAQIIEIKALQAKIKSADAVLNARENKIKEDEKKAEKGEPTDKSPRVSGVDQNGKPAEFVVVVNEKKQTAKVQLKKRGDSELARQKIESDLKIQTDDKGRKFVETQNKSRVYIDEKVTSPKVEVKAPATKAKAKAKVKPVVEVKAETPVVEAPKVEESETEKISRGAEMLKNMSEDERDNFIDDWREDKIPRESLPGGARAITLYEAKKLVPNPTSKPKRVTIDNAFSLSMEHSFVINIDGVIYGLNKYEDPDATSDALDKYDEPKQYVWAYTNINEGGDVIETNESDIDELINEIKSSKESKVEPIVEPKAEAVKKPTVTAEDRMGIIDTIKGDIETIIKEIKDIKEEPQRQINEIEGKIIDTKNESKIEDYNDDITIIKNKLEEDLEDPENRLAEKFKELNKEIDSLKKSDLKNPENKKTLVDYIDAAIATLNSLNKLTYAKLDAGVTLGTLKAILKGIRQIVIKTNDFNVAVREMAIKYKNKHKNENITIDEFIEEINDYLDSTYVEPQADEESLDKDIDKFTTEIKNAIRQAQSQSKTLREKAAAKIKDMLKGKFKSISAVHMRSIMTRLVSVNVENQTQYDKFLEYVEKVIEITNYDAKVREANVKRKKAKDNTIGNNPKLGDLSLDLLGSLSRMLNINPKLISKEVFDSYYNIVDDLSKRTTILSPGERADLNEKVNEIVDSIEQNEEMLPNLKDAYDNFADKVVKNGVVNYAKTLTKMLEDGVINNNEFTLMKKYKSKIVDAKVKVKMTEQEIADEKAELINEITNTAITLDSIVGDEFRLERELVKRLAKLLNKESLENLDNKQLKDLLKIIDNINNGFVSKSTQQMVEILNEKKNSSLLVTSIPKSVKGIFKKITQPIRGVFTRDKYGVNINPLFNIDEVFGDFKTKNIFNSVLNQSAVSQQQFQSEVAEIQGKLIKAESAIASSFNRFSRNENKIQLSKFKMMVYMMQLEFESNPNSNQVHQAMKTLNATIDFAETNKEKSRYSKEDIDQMKAIKKEFEKDGEIDIDKLYNSFNKAEKNALKVFDEVNSLMTKKASYTATVINGNKIAPLKNYIYYNTISDSNISEAQIDSLLNNTNPNQQKGTESKNLQERSGNVSPVDLNPFAAVNSSAKSVLVNYHMTEPIRTARKTLKNAREILEKNKKNNENVGEQFDILSVIEKAYDTATRDLLETNFSESSNIDAAVQYLTKTGYRAMLGSVTRATAELTSNAAFVTTNNPKDMAAGFKYRKLANSGKGKNILTNLKSKVTSRNYPAGGLSSNYVDLSAFTDRTVRGGKTRTKTVNGVKQIFDFTAGNWVNLAEFTADFLIATPDKVVMKQLYFGAFSREFKKETGIDPDFEKIEANDEEYMDKYQDALEKATNQADNQTVTAGSSMNAYMGMLQNVVRKGDGGGKAAFKTFNQFMNRFTIQEYITARKGVKALVGKGDITWEEGAQVLAAVSARMTLYLTFGKVFSQSIVYLAQSIIGWGDDDDDEDEGFLDFILDGKTPLQMLYQSAVSSATTLFFGRNFGNAVRTTENYFIEKANKEYGEDIGLRNKEYDPFKDALQFDQFSKVDELSDLAVVMAGPLGPIINAGTLAIKLATKEAPSEDRAIETMRKEWYRLGLEAAGSFGLVPLYRDIRKVQMDWVYDELKTELKEEAAKKEIREAEEASTLETKTNTLNRMRDAYKDETSRSIIDYELKKLSDPEFRKEENKKEEDEKTRLAKKYGYESMTEFEYDDKEKYDKVFGDDSPYRKRMAPIAKIRKELKDRMAADKFGKPYKPTEKTEKEKQPVDAFGTNAFESDAFKSNAFESNAFETNAFGKKRRRY